MIEFVSQSTFFGAALTMIVFAFANSLQRKVKIPLLNPILVSAAVIIALLTLLDIPNSVYQSGCHVLTFLLTPATICLAISFYEQYQNLKEHIPAVLVGVIMGTVCSLGSIYAMGKVLGLEHALVMSLMPKSVTTAIGIVLAEELGGLAAVTTAAIAITGIFGNVIGTILCKVFRLTDPVARGVAFGTSAHVIGTAKAAEMSELTGAVSSLSLTLAGIVTSVLLSFVAQYL